jgi:hypothetical protein
MFNLPIFDFCIGMTFFFVTLTLICSMINEYVIDRCCHKRKKFLLEGISGLFHDVMMVADFYCHPLIRGLYRDDQVPLKPDPNNPKLKLDPGKDSIQKCMEPFNNIFKNLPSYIPGRTFATALLDILAPAKDSKDPQALKDIRNKIAGINNERIKEALLPLIDSATDDLDKAKQDIEKWFEDSMDRLQGWFKRNAKKWLFGVAAIVCLLLNADSIMVGKMLWENEVLRAAVVKQAISEAPLHSPGTSNPANPENQENDASKPDDEKKVVDSKDLHQKIQAEIAKLNLPLGWVWPEEGKLDPRDVPMPKDPDKIIIKLLGILLTTVAISLGSNFWIDLLNNFVNLRRSGKVPPKSNGENK